MASYTTTSSKARHLFTTCETMSQPYDTPTTHSWTPITSPPSPDSSQHIASRKAQIILDHAAPSCFPVSHILHWLLYYTVTCRIFHFYVSCTNVGCHHLCNYAIYLCTYTLHFVELWYLVKVSQLDALHSQSAVFRSSNRLKPTSVVFEPTLVIKLYNSV